MRGTGGKRNRRRQDGQDGQDGHDGQDGQDEQDEQDGQDGQDGQDDRTDRTNRTNRTDRTTRERIVLLPMIPIPPMIPITASAFDTLVGTQWRFKAGLLRVAHFPFLVRLSQRTRGFASDESDVTGDSRTIKKKHPQTGGMRMVRWGGAPRWT